MILREKVGFSVKGSSGNRWSLLIMESPVAQNFAGRFKKIHLSEK